MGNHEQKHSHRGDLSLLWKVTFIQRPLLCSFINQDTVTVNWWLCGWATIKWLMTLAQAVRKTCNLFFQISIWFRYIYLVIFLNALNKWCCFVTTPSSFVLPCKPPEEHNMSCGTHPAPQKLKTSSSFTIICAQHQLRVSSSNGSSRNAQNAPWHLCNKSRRRWTPLSGQLLNLLEAPLDPQGEGHMRHPLLWCLG